MSPPPSETPDGPAYRPLYRQVKALLLRSLQRTEWRPGEAIPSETELATRFKVSQGTMRKAIDELAAENLLVRRQGKGTYVATHAAEQVRFRFLRLAPDVASPIGLTRRLIDCRRERAPAEPARSLRLRTGDPVVRIRRVLSFQALPVVFDEIWLPAGLFQGLTFEQLATHRGPLYGLFETGFGVRMIRAEEKIRAVGADGAAVEWLGVAPGAPLLAVERLSFTYDDAPVELRRGLYDTAAHHYRNELQ